MLNIVTALIYRRQPNLEVLFIDRNKIPYKGYLAFPGGKMEDGEQLTEAIFREIHEETGITHSEILKIEHLCILNELYLHKEELINHFLLNYYQIYIDPTVDVKSTPEGTLVWMNQEEIKKKKSRIIPSDFKIFQYFLEKQNNEESNNVSRFEGVIVNEGSKQNESLKLVKWKNSV